MEYNSTHQQQQVVRPFPSRPSNVCAGIRVNVVRVCAAAWRRIALSCVIVFCLLQSVSHPAMKPTHTTTTISAATPSTATTTATTTARTTTSSRQRRHEHTKTTKPKTENQSIDRSMLGVARALHPSFIHGDNTTDNTAHTHSITVVRQPASHASQPRDRKSVV